MDDDKYDEIVQENVPPDGYSKTISEDGDVLGSSCLNLPSTVEAAAQAMDLEENNSLKRKKPGDHTDFPENLKLSPIAKRKAVNSDTKLTSRPSTNTNSASTSDDFSLTKVNKVPSNYTLNSSGKDKVVIIKPEKGSDIFKYPTKFATAFDKTNFGKASVKDIRTNRLKELIIVELNNPNDIEKLDLLKMTKIGDWTVSCYKPNSEILKSGVIAPIDINENIDDWKDIIITEKNVTVIKVERLLKNTREGRIPSTSVKVTFNCQTLPKYLKISHFSYPIRPYVRNPVQCFRCQRLGHTAGACKASRSRCLVCAGNHSVRDCQTNLESVKCANCHGKHKANSRECDLIRQAYEIERRRANGESYVEAKNSVEYNKREIVPTFNTVTTNAEVHHQMNSQILSKGSYRDVARKSLYTPMTRIEQSLEQDINYNKDQQSDEYVYSNENNYFNGRREPTKIFRNCKQCVITYTKEASTQTDLLQVIEKVEEKISLTKLRDCLAEILSSNIWKESNNNRKRIIEGAIRNSFGTDLTEKQCQPEISGIPIESGVLSSECEEVNINHPDTISKNNNITNQNKKNEKQDRSIPLGSIGKKKENIGKGPKASRLYEMRDIRKKKEQKNLSSRPSSYKT
jgi:hypothetical protein